MKRCAERVLHSLAGRMTSSATSHCLAGLAFYEHGEPRKPRPSGLSSLSSPRAKTAKTWISDIRQRDPAFTGADTALSFFSLRNSKAWHIGGGGGLAWASHASRCLFLEVAGAEHPRRPRPQGRLRLPSLTGARQGFPATVRCQDLRSQSMPASP